MKLYSAAVVCNVCGQVCEDYHLTQHKCKHQDDKNYIRKKFRHEDECQDNKKHSVIKICEPEKIDLQKYTNRNLDELNRDLSLLKETNFLNLNVGGVLEILRTQQTYKTAFAKF